MIAGAPRTSVDEPLVVQRVEPSPQVWGLPRKFKLVVHGVFRFENFPRVCYDAINLQNPTRRQAERGSPVRLEVNSVLYGILADEGLVQLLLDAVRAAQIKNLARLRAKLELRLAEHRMLEQYGALDAWRETS
jgi:hypothetical protein